MRRIPSKGTKFISNVPFCLKPQAWIAKGPVCLGVFCVWSYRSSETKSLETESYRSNSGRAQGLGKVSPLPWSLQKRFCRAEWKVMPQTTLGCTQWGLGLSKITDQPTGGLYYIWEEKRMQSEVHKWLSLCHCTPSEGCTSALLSVLLWLFSYRGLQQKCWLLFQHIHSQSSVPGY